MTHLLDTTSCIDHLRRGTASHVTTRLAAAAPGSVVLCSVVLAELLYGAHRSAQAPRNLSLVQAFCGPFASIPFNDRPPRNTAGSGPTWLLGARRSAPTI